MSFATKLSHIVYADGTAVDTMKHPVTDSSKNSLPGEEGGVLLWDDELKIRGE
jgi:hypothetical protein